MIYSEINSGSGAEILASNQYQAIPVTVAGSDIVYAGTPLDSDGAVTTGDGAIGILLYDVDPTVNPNGAAVVIGIVDAVKAMKHCHVQYSNDIITALPMVRFRVNINEGLQPVKLDTLAVGELALTPTFDPDEDTYTASTTNAKDAVTATAVDGAAIVISCGGTDYESGDEITWDNGDNEVTVTVSKPGYYGATYTVTVSAS